MSDEAPSDGASSEAEPTQPARSAPPRRSPIVRFAVLGCALAVAAVVLPRIPRDREVDFRLDDPANVIGIELSWSHEDGAGEAIQGGSWHFERGQAPRSLTTTVHLPNGRYAVDVVVQRTDARDELRRVIDLSSTDHVTVPLR